MIRPNSMEVLEARIAPALIIQNPLPDILVGAGSGGKTVQLSQMFDPLLDHPFHTVVTFTFNFDSDPNTEGLQPTKIRIELFDNEAPLTVQNFLRYVTDEGNSSYIGTFLHRLFDFGSDNDPGMDIIQGGGFPAADQDEHIETFSQVHNEFSDARPNTRGTIAMAKTGLGPNTGTSEWFINLHNNSEVLGSNNNSGFTVFGQVIEGMELLDRIAALPKAPNLGGALTDVPVQNFNPAGPGKPTPANFVTITDVEVEAQEVGNDAGITYTATFAGTDIFVGEGTTLPVNGNKLELLYDAAANGVATITVTASKAGETPVQETFTVTLRPNLIATVSEDKVGSILLPGEGGVEKSVVKIQNNGGANYNGTATIKFYLSSIGGDDPQGTKVDEDDILLHTLTDHVLSINAAGEMVLEINPEDLALGSGLIEGSNEFEFYRLIVEVIPAENGPQQLFTDDEVAVDGGAHVLTNGFGTLDFSQFGLGKRNDVTLKYLDPQTGKMVELSMKGPGRGSVTLNKGDDEITTDDQAELLIKGTNAKSQLKIVDPDADGNGKTMELADSVTFLSVEVTDFIGLLDFSIVDEIGNVALSGGAKTVIFGNFNETPGDTRLTIGGSPNLQPVTIKLGNVKDLSIDSTQRIKSITALSWLDARDPDNTLNGVNDRINAPSISSITIDGDFEADVETSIVSRLSNIFVDGSINNATIRSKGDIGKVSAGGLSGSSIIAADDLSSLSIDGGINDATIQIGGSIGRIDADSLVDSEISSDSSLSNLTIRGTIDKSTIQADGNINKMVATGLTESNISTGSKLSNLSIGGAITDSTIQANGSINKITANSLTEANISTNSNLSSLSIDGAVTDSTIQADGKISKVAADSLTETNISTDSILSNLSIGGTITGSTIQADGDIKKVVADGLTDSTVSTDSILTHLAIAGAVSEATIEADGDIKKFTAEEMTDSNVVAGTLTNIAVANLVTNSTIRTTGDIGKVTVGGLISSNIFAGTDTRPGELSDFDTIRTIQSITIEGVGAGDAFVDSNVAAAVIGKIVVRGINGNNGDEAFGFVADKVDKYIRVGGPTLSNLDEPGENPADSLEDYQLLIL
jgi:cyclophilin family peptidyl-prolyl cis-trans isomerase